MKHSIIGFVVGIVGMVIAQLAIVFLQAVPVAVGIILAVEVLKSWGG